MCLSNDQSHLQNGHGDVGGQSLDNNGENSDTNTDSSVNDDDSSGAQESPNEAEQSNGTQQDNQHDQSGARATNCSEVPPVLASLGWLWLMLAWLLPNIDGDPSEPLMARITFGALGNLHLRLRGIGCHPSGPQSSGYPGAQRNNYSTLNMIPSCDSVLSAFAFFAILTLYNTIPGTTNEQSNTLVIPSNLTSFPQAAHVIDDNHSTNENATLYDNSASNNDATTLPDDDVNTRMRVSESTAVQPDDSIRIINEDGVDNIDVLIINIGFNLHNGAEVYSPSDDDDVEYAGDIDDSEFSSDTSGETNEDDDQVYFDCNSGTTSETDEDDDLVYFDCDSDTTGDSGYATRSETDGTSSTDESSGEDTSTRDDEEAVEAPDANDPPHEVPNNIALDRIVSALEECAFSATALEASILKIDERNTCLVDVEPQAICSSSGRTDTEESETVVSSTSNGKLDREKISPETVDNPTCNINSHISTESAEHPCMTSSSGNANKKMAEGTIISSDKDSRIIQEATPQLSSVPSALNDGPPSAQVEQGTTDELLVSLRSRLLQNDANIADCQETELRNRPLPDESPEKPNLIQSDQEPEQQDI